MPPNPVILGFDISAAHCAAALLSGSLFVAKRFEEISRDPAGHLMSMLNDILSEGGHVWGDLDAIGVGIGPGDADAVQIAISVARQLASPLEIPVVGVSVLEAQAQGHRRPCLSVSDAPEGYVYAQEFTRSGAGALWLTSLEQLESNQTYRVGPAKLGGTGVMVPVATAIASIARMRFQTETPPLQPLSAPITDDIPADTSSSRI